VLLQVKIWFQNHRYKCKRQAKEKAMAEQKPTQPGKRWINPITTKMGRSPFDGSQSADQMGFWDLGDFTWRKKIISVLLVLFLFLPVSDTILLFLACQSAL
jgi:hypothetical protein